MDDLPDPEAKRIWRVSALGRQSAWWFVALSVAGFLVVLVMWITADDDVELVFLVVIYVVLVAPFVTMAVFAALRPYVAVGSEGIEVQNPVRRHQISWSNVIGVTPGYSGLSFQTKDGKTVTAWAVQKSNLATWRGKETRADRVAAEIRLLVQGDVEA
jgi:hypothetical protein